MCVCVQLCIDRMEKEQITNENEKLNWKCITHRHRSRNSNANACIYTHTHTINATHYSPHVRLRARARASAQANERTSKSKKNSKFRQKKNKIILPFLLLCFLFIGRLYSSFFLLAFSASSCLVLFISLCFFFVSSITLSCACMHVFCVFFNAFWLFLLHIFVSCEYYVSAFGHIRIKWHRERIY